MKIFITGNLGFIGTHLSELLIDNGYTIVGFDKRQSSEKEKYKCIQGNILDSELLNLSISNDIDLIIHLAAEHKDNVHPESLYYDVNVRGTKNIIDACEINNINRIIFTSTIALYGLDLTDSNENSTPNPFNDYGDTKLQAEKLLIQWWKKEKNRSLFIIRPTAVFGERNRGNVFNLMKQISNNRFIIVGNGKNKKSIAYVGHLIEFIACSMNNNGFHIVNYADKPDLTMNQLVTIIHKILNKKEKRLSVPYWMGIIAGYTYDALSFVLGKQFSITSIKIKKFCSNSIINTNKLERYNMKPPIPLHSAIERTLRFEFDIKK